jgi:hypothetical protein
MDCDDEVRLVKRQHYAHADSIDVAGVSRLAELVLIDLNRFGYQPFHVRHRSFEAT